VVPDVHGRASQKPRISVTLPRTYGVRAQASAPYLEDVHVEAFDVIPRQQPVVVVNL
jgi:hypothetical protein